MSYDANVTVMGRIGSEPRFFMADGDAPDFVTFRMATTRSYFNRSTNAWVDGATTWFTVKAWRTLATNIRTSLKKGDAVIVHGQLDTQRWTTSEGIERESLVIEAQAVGPNLLRGVASFRSSNSAASPASASGSQPAKMAWPGAAPEVPATSNSSRTDFDDAVASLRSVGDGHYLSPEGEVDSDPNATENDNGGVVVTGTFDDESLTITGEDEREDALTA